MSLLPMKDGMGGLLSGPSWDGGLFGNDDAHKQARTAAAFALLGGQGNIAQRLGQAGTAGMQNFQQTKQQAQLQKYRDIQMRQMEAQAAELERERQMQEQMRAAAKSSMVPAQQGPLNEPGQVGDERSLSQGGFSQDAFISKMMELDPLQAMKLKQQFAPKQADYKVVGNNLVQIGQDGVKPVYESPVEQKDDPFVRLLKQSGIDPASPQGQQILRQRINKETSHAPGTSVNVGITQEREESKAVGKFLGEQYADIQKAGFSANSKLNRASRMEQLLQGISTGKLAPASKEVAAVAQSLGITLDPNLGAKQAFEALSNELALEARNPSGGAGMPGAMSDKDREFLQNITPSLSKTPEGNRIIIETNKRLAKRDADVARLAREYRQKRGTLDEGFFETLRSYSETNPLFDGMAANPAPARGGDDIQDLVNKYRSR